MLEVRENTSGPAVICGWNDGSGCAVRGYSENGRGLYGQSGGGGIGVFGQSDSGKGVRGVSASGFAGYFEGPTSYFSGNVGIGTTSPTAKLHVNGGGFTVTTNDTYAGHFTTAAQAGYGVYGYASNSYDFAYRYGGFFEAEGLRGIGVCGKANGNEGVAVYGTCGAGNGKAVYGIASAAGTGVYGSSYTGVGVHGESSSGLAGQFDGHVRITGFCYTNAFPTTGGMDLRLDSDTGLVCVMVSSKDFKKDIKPLQDNFDEIMKVQPKSFINTESGKRDIGVIAEDLDALGLKNLLVYKQGKPYAVYYDKISLYLLEVMKEHFKETDRLRQENDELRERISAIEKVVFSGEKARTRSAH
jgi:hypothetical protein